MLKHKMVEVDWWLKLGISISKKDIILLNIKINKILE